MTHRNGHPCAAHPCDNCPTCQTRCCATADDSALRAQEYADTLIEDTPQLVMATLLAEVPELQAVHHSGAGRETTHGERHQLLPKPPVLPPELPPSPKVPVNTTHSKEAAHGQRA